MQADEIRTHRQQSERDAAWGEGNHSEDANYLQARIALALWVTAESLAELNAKLADVIDASSGRFPGVIRVRATE